MSIKNKSILFLMYPVASHVFASLNLAYILEKEGFEVVYAGEKLIGDIACVNEFKFYELKSIRFGIGLEKKLSSIHKKDIYLDEFILRINNTLYKERDKEIELLLKIINPQFVFIDSFSSNDFLFFYNSIKNAGLKVAFIQTMLSMYIKDHIPPPNSEIIPSSRLFIELNIYIQQLLFFQRRNEIIQYMKFVGYDDFSLIRKSFRNSTISKDFHLEKRKYYSPGFNNITELILAPEELEFDGNLKRENEIYVGYQVYVGRKDTIQEPAFINLFQKCKEIKTKREKVIYCSFGSLILQQKYVKAVSTFLDKLINLLSEIKDYFLIISIDEKKIQSLINEKSDKVMVLSFVPQLKVLSYADLFITHGGLNSIKESLYFEVPLLLYPFNKYFDQKGNAARVVSKGLGLRGNIFKDSKEEIRAKIHQLLHDSSYQTRMREFNKRVHQKYPDSLFLNKFYEILGETADTKKGDMD